jgi:hypothetical protein
VIGEVLLLKKNGAAETAEDAQYDDLDGALDWINENAAANDKYVVLLGANQTTGGYNSPADKSGLEITLRGYSAERKITWNGTHTTTFTGALFSLRGGVALTLDENITLDGQNAIITSQHQTTYGMALVYVVDATLTMKSYSKIINAKVTYFDHSAAVRLQNGNANFVMEGGEISGNEASYGLYIYTGTFTMSGGAIKNNTGNGGLVLYSGATATMSGGEISGHTGGLGYGVHIASFEGRFTMSGNAVISGNTVGVYSGQSSTSNINSDSPFTMTGGTIENNEVGVYNFNVPFTMTGGTIRNNTALIGGGIRFVGGKNSGAFYVSGNVTIFNNGVGLDGSTTAQYNTIIYIGDSFNPAGNIAIDGYSYNASDFNNTWGSTSGKVFLKGGTAASPTTVTAQDVAKFAAGKVCDTYGAQYNFSTEKTGGTLSLSLNDSNFGVAKWTTN